MRVLIAGANGKIGRHLVKLMAQSGHQARAMVRREEQLAEMERLGASERVLGDLERDCGEALNDCDAVIFTAGSGAHTGPDKTLAVDQNGAIRLIDGARNAGVRRFIMVSAMGADQPEQGPEQIRHYLRAKQRADDHLRGSGLAYTVVRPGPLTDEPATGRIKVAAHLGRIGDIPRADVAAVLLATLDADNTEGTIFEVLTGELSIPDALRQL